MSESFRERIKSNIQLLNGLTTYEKQHELEWCPISDEMLKTTYPGQCETQQARDEKVDSMTAEEFRSFFESVMRRYRMLKRKKQKRDKGEIEELEEPQQETTTDKEQEEAATEETVEVRQQ